LPATKSKGVVLNCNQNENSSFDRAGAQMSLRAQRSNLQPLNWRLLRRKNANPKTIVFKLNVV